MSETNGLPRGWAIPSTWSWTTMGGIAAVVGGGTPTSSDPSNFGGAIPWITPADLSDFTGKIIASGRRSLTEKGLSESSATLLPRGSVLFSSRAPIGYVAIAGAPLTTNQGFKSFVLRDGLLPDYVYFYLHRAKPIALSLASGTTFLEISAKKAAQIPIPIAPIAEQRRIVAKIEELFSDLDAGVATLERVRANLKRYRAAVLKAAVEGRLTERWRQANPPAEPASKLLERILIERRKKWEQDQLAKYAAAGKQPPKGWQEKYQDPPAPKATSLPDLPKGWCWASLDQVCSVFSDCAHRTPNYSPLGYPAVRPRDVVNGLLNLAEAARVDETEFKIQTARRIPQPGDILYSRELSFGWGVLVPPNVRLCMSQGMVAFRPAEPIDPHFALLFINGPEGRKQSEANAVGSAHPHVNLSAIRAYCIPLPPPAEQQQIVLETTIRLSAIDGVETGIMKAAERSSQLRNAILRHAFDGKLVPQDPKDEPVTLLLERTKTQLSAIAGESGQKLRKIRVSTKRQQTSENLFAE